MQFITNFLAPKIEIDETGVASKIIGKGIFAAVFVVGGFFVWASFAPLSGAVIADGKIKISTNRKTIQHLEGGIVSKILVRDGDVVKKGQQLLELENTRSSAELNILNDQYDNLLAKEARLSAQKTLSNRIVFPDRLLNPLTKARQQLITKERALFDIQRKILGDQISLLQKELEHSRNAENAYTDQIVSIEQNLKHKQEQMQMRETLLEKNFVGKADVLNFKQSLLDKKEQMSAQMADLSTTRAGISELQLRIIDSKNRYIQTADSELKDVDRQIFEVAERIKPAEDSNNRRQLLAPITGQVIALKVTTIGGVIAPGQPVMDIVPFSNDLVVEVRVKTTDIDSIYFGQKAEVQLNAFNQRTTPTIAGKVIYVAGDAIENPQTGESIYPAHIKIDADALAKIKHIKIEPGMPVTAYIKTQDRTMMEYFLSPLTQRMRRTFREE